MAKSTARKSLATIPLLSYLRSLHSHPSFPLLMYFYSFDESPFPTSNHLLSPFTPLNGLRLPSRVMADKLSTVPRTKLARKIGQLTAPEMARVGPSRARLPWTCSLKTSQLAWMGTLSCVEPQGSDDGPGEQTTARRAAARHRAAGCRRAAPEATGGERRRHRVLRCRRTQHPARRRAAVLQFVRSCGLHLARQAAGRLLDPDGFRRLLGYSGWSIDLPQALAGVASVALLYRLVRPVGAPAAIVAALLLAIMPIAVAIDRSNNTDSWLILFLLLATRIALRGRGLSLVVAMALLGLAFNAKMLAALVCGPALLAGWLLAGIARLAPAPRLDDSRRRHARRRVAFLGGGVRSHAQGEPALCRQQPRQFDARAHRHAQRAGSVRAQRADASPDHALRCL